MIQHVTRVIHRSQLDACIAFYGLLGLRPVPAPPGIAGRAVWLQWPESGSASQLHLMFAEEPEAEPGHFAIVCRDYDQVTARLVANGHAVDPRSEHWGSPRAYVHDPAGNVVELMEWAPGESSASGGQRE